MPTPVIQMFTAWSISRYMDYTQCPAFAKYKHLDKLPTEPSTAMARGTDIHQKAEGFALKRINRMPIELKPFKQEFAALRKVGPALQTEIKWALTSDWAPTAYFASNTWLRVQADVSYVTKQNWLDVIDHKTGKQKDWHELQLELYAATGMAVKPTVDGVRGKLWYIDLGVELVREYTPADGMRLRKEWAKRVKPMLNDKRFAPRPGNYCTWCDFSRSKGGPCKY